SSTSAVCSPSKRGRREPLGSRALRARRDRAAPAMLPAGRAVRAGADGGDAPPARRVFSLLRPLDVPPEIRTYRRRAFGKETRFELHLGDSPRAVQVLNEAGVVDARLAPLDVPPRRLVARSCCRAAYLRGALLAAGSVSGPRTPHLELRTATRDAAEFLAGVAAQESMRLGVVERASHAAAYARG